ncbi:MAG: ABC transporter substrate-binding protein [Chloroflexi bacterium]|nr:ABC transporter substrate-binding protein [Chloroflexota bacterium]
MSTHTWSILSLIVSVTGLLTACQPPPFVCTDAIGCVDIAPGEPIELGVLQALSGGAAPFGVEQSRSIEIAIARRGDQILGHPIELQSEDEGCSPEGGTNAALKVATRQQTVAILGTTCSGSAVTAAKVMSEAGLVMVSGANVAPSLTATGGERGADWQAGYFRTIYNGAAMGKVAAIFAFQELGLTKAATINDGDAYTRAYTDMFGQAFMELGGEIALVTAVNKGDTDMQPVLTAVALSKAEFVFLPIFPPEGALIVRGAKTVPGLENIIFIGADSLRADTFIQEVGADGVGMYFLGTPPPEGVAIDELRSEYESRYGEPPPGDIYGFGYDAANMVLNAIKTAAVQEQDGTLHIGRQALREALYATAGFEGVTGKLTCDEFGDCGASKFNIVRLDDPAAGLEGLLSNVVYTFAPEQ